MKYLVKHIIEVARSSTMPLANMQNKLCEETGELAEAVNYHEGFSQHKTMKEPLEGEVADVINSAIGVLVKAYPDLDTDQLYKLLFDQLELKTQKWVDTQDQIIKSKMVDLIKNPPTEPTGQQCPFPEFDGMTIDKKEIAPGVFAIGLVRWNATLGTWVCLADVGGALCSVEVKLTPKG